MVGGSVGWRHQIISSFSFSSLLLLRGPNVFLLQLFLFSFSFLLFLHGPNIFPHQIFSSFPFSVLFVFCGPNIVLLILSSPLLFLRGLTFPFSKYFPPFPSPPFSSSLDKYFLPQTNRAQQTKRPKYK